MLTLSDTERAMLEGERGRGVQLSMELIVAAAEATGAPELIEVEFAHVGSGFYSGPASLDFAEFLLRHGATVSVPTHTNASLVDFSSPGLRARDDYPEAVDGAARLMEIYERLGCSSMWSCAPYHHEEGRPNLGQQIIGSESNAVSFFNSVLGARTNKYGDFLDISGAIVGRVPLAGLHTDEGRLATHVIRLETVPANLVADGSFFHVLGIIVGREAGARVPVIDGLATASEDELKAIAAAAASSGGVEMFHVVGVTPEAPTLADALGGRSPARESSVSSAELLDVRASLSTDSAGPLRAVCLGTPHFSVDEFDALRTALAARRVDPGVSLFVTTSRAVMAELRLRGWADELEDAGVQVVLDTCSYFTPRMRGLDGLVMTNSAKWAYYAPGMLQIPVAFASLGECVDSAVAGAVVRTSGPGSSSAVDGEVMP